MKQADIDKLRSRKVSPQAHLIHGKQVSSQDERQLEVISPIDGKPFTKIAAGGAADMNAAIASARKTFDSGVWSDMEPKTRKAILLKWAELVEAEALELAVMGVRDNGTEIGMAYKAEPGSAAGTIRFYAESIDKIYGEVAPTAPNRLGLIHKTPIGVIGVIVPWNFPMMIGAWKLAPALSAGNTVVLKPAEVASLTLLRLAQLALEAGMPPGVFNVVTGKGSVVGETLALSMDVDVLVFTGSGATGRRLLEYSARSNLKRVYLELGGKSPQVVFNDMPDFDLAAKTAASSIFRNSGQVCIAASRLLIQEDVHDEFVAAVVEHAKALRVGDPLNMENQIGAVTSSDQLEQNIRFVETAKTEGARLETGGGATLTETGGYYMEPTVFTNVGQSSNLMQNEVFGPVLAVSSFKDENEAILKANGTDFGLSSSVWTSNLSRAHRMVKNIKAGIVHVNTYGGASISVPLGGVKQSGNGHDKSLHALDKYFDLKTAWIAL